MDFKQVFSGRKYNCKSPVHIFNRNIKDCESGSKVKSKKENRIIISSAYLKVHFTSKYGYFSKMFELSFYIKSWKMSIKHYFANMGIAGNYALGKMFVLMSSLRISKKSYMWFLFSLRGPSSPLCTRFKCVKITYDF